MSDLGVALFWSSVQITLVSTTAAIACLLLKGCQPRVRNCLLQITFTFTLCLSVLAFSPWPRWDAGRLAQEVAARAVETNVTVAEADGAAMITVPADRDAEATPTAPTSDLTTTWNWIDAVSASIRSIPDSLVAQILTLLILAGLAIGLFRCFIGVIAVRRVVQVACPVTDDALLTLLGQVREELTCPRCVSVVETDRLTTAATVGWRKPLILLPVGWRLWSDNERRAVLAHELAHIVRQDFASLVIAQISTVLHFYHPLVHWLTARLRLEQELVADAMAAHIVGGRASYLTVLATMALREEDRPMGWPARSFLPTRGTLLRRIEMLRDSRQRTGRIRGGLAMSALTAVVVVGVLAAGLRSHNANGQGALPTLREQQAEEIPADIAASQINLKFLGLAMHNYHDRHGHFPPAVVTHESGETHSWRVALLPYLGLQELYDEYQQDEPWDSDANMRVLEQIPNVYRAPQDDEESSNSSYFVFAGDGTAFSGEEGVRIRDFVDGTSNTILVVEFKMEVPWTKPEDIDYPVDPLHPPELSGWYEDRLMTCLADGSARAFPLELDKEVSQALIEIADGNNIDWDEIPDLR